MDDRPVYTVAQISVNTEIGCSLAVTFLADDEGNVMFWDGHDAATHVAAEQNEQGDGWWVVMPRMVRGIREID